MTEPNTLLQRLRRSLHSLEQKQAKLGINAPASLTLEIEDHRTAITLTEQLAAGHLTEAAWRKQLQPLLVTIEARQVTEEVSALNIGGVNFSHITGSAVTVGNIDASVHAGGDVNIYHHYSPSPASKSGRRDYYAHINLPPNFVPRPELLAAIKQTLLGERQEVALTSALKTSAVHGMGGIGKSVMARALCDEPDVQATFKDGILWTTLGQSVSDDDLKAKLRTWIEELGGIISVTAPSLNQLKNSLAEQLKTRVCLLIVDDMWRYEDANWFNGGGANCRLLLTTRDAEAARQLGAAIAPIETMRESEALTLLAQWAGQPLQQTHPKPATQIVKRLGYLPLALKLAGEQLRRQEPAAWLASFKAQKLKSRRDKSVRGNLFDTFALSLTALTDEEQQLYTGLVIFKEDEPILLTAIAMLWSQLADYDPDESEALLFDLADRALLQLSDDKGTVSLHDLVREFMAEQLSEEGQRQAHTRLLNGYRATQTGEGWPTAPDDGYLYTHLAYHLDTLADNDETAAKELNHLFADDAWLQVRVAADGYRYDGYLSDLELAWQRANSVTRQQIAADQAPDGIGEWVHYALVQSSINALAGQYPPALVAQAVTTQQWTVERAISVTANIVDPQARVDMSVQLLKVDSLQPREHKQLVHIALAAAQAIGNEGNRAYALTALAPLLSGALLAQALEVAQAIDDELPRAYALTALAPQLSGALLAQALEAAQAIGNEGSRAYALTALAPLLSGEAQATVLVQAL
ncbi:MAG: hypothetical protein KDJ97_34465, partial [Anaerolineae bacterium]|nr:hypothetical protein [Anaerolineae bacterium]